MTIVRVRLAREAEIADGLFAGGHLEASLFSIVGAPVVEVTSVVRLPERSTQFAITAPGATQATVWSRNELSQTNWLSWGSVTLTNGVGMFTDGTAAGQQRRFYRLSLP